jgi:hypothetical protein
MKAFYKFERTLSIFFKGIDHKWGARKLTGENLKVFWAKFSTLSLAVWLCMQLHGIE